MTELKSFAWIAINEATDDDGFYLEDGPAVHAVERCALLERGAPDTELIQFISVLPESRDEALVEAMVPQSFIDWAKADENLVWYEDGVEGE